MLSSMFAHTFKKIERTPMSVAGWLAGFTGILFIRYFLETFSSRGVQSYVTSDMPTLLHYSLFYLGVLILTVLVISVITPEIPRTLIKTILFFFPLVWLAPVIDLLHGGGAMAYIFATPKELLTDFFTYFGPLVPAGGITLGIRIELGLILAGIAGYVYFYTHALGKTLRAVFAAYVVVFVAVALPSILVASLSMGGSVIPIFWNLQHSSLLSHSFLHPSDAYDLTRRF